MILYARPVQDEAVGISFKKRKYKRYHLKLRGERYYLIVELSVEVFDLSAEE